MQSVEALLDPTLDAGVRQEWERLQAAGLPSQARHSGASNAPHVTLAVTTAIGDDGERRLRSALPPTLPPLRLGGLLVFTGAPGRHVLARAVVVGAPLLDLHARVVGAVGDEPGVPDHVRPGGWTPHVTLAHRLDATRLAAAVDLLADVDRERSGQVAAVRRWDPVTRTTWTL